MIIAGYRQRETLRRGDDGCLTVGMPEDVAAALHVWRPAAEHLYPALPRAAFAPAQVQFVLDYLLWLYREIGSTPWGKRRKWRSFSEFAGDWLRRFIHNLLSRPYIDPNLETAAEVCPWLFTPEGVGAVSYALLEKHL